MNPTQYLVQTRSVLTIYRDCVKLIHRMVQNPTKASAAQVLLRKQFQKHKDEVDIQKVNSLKIRAVQGISNYLIYTVQRDYKMLNKKPVNILEEDENEKQIEQEGQEQKKNKTSRAEN